MKSFTFSAYVMGGSIVVAMLAGCGASQAPISATGAMPQIRALTTHAERGGSWM